MTDRQTDRIGIIIPVYNAEKYLHRCVESFKKQTYPYWHMILVDDGSTDCSGKICDQLSEADDRIRVIHQKNTGVAGARNAGLDCCADDYICFEDPDDYVMPEYLEKMIAAIKGSQADLCMAPGFDIEPNGTVIAETKNHTSRLLRIDEYDWNGDIQHPVCWGVLYKRELLKGLRFQSGYYVGEDSLFFAEVLKRANSLYYLGESLYYYVHYPESAFFGSFDAKKFTEFNAWKAVVKLWDNAAPVRVALAIRCKTMYIKYYGDALFTREYASQLMAEYRRNFIPYIIDTMRRNGIKSAIGGGLFFVSPRLFMGMKDLCIKHRKV